MGGAGAAMGLSAWLFGVQELYATGVAAIVLVLAARAWVATRRWDLHVTRVVHPTRVAAGQEARVELAVRNPDRRPTPPVEARDPFDGGRRWARFAIAPVPADEIRRSSYRLPSTHRGVYHLGPLELRLSDPLGLASTTRTTAQDTSLTVHPRFEMVTVRAVSSHRDHDRRLPQPVLGKGGNEFYTLREYVPGDDLRHVHWASTARIDNLVIRQPENLRRGRMTVAADLRAPLHTDDSLEEVLSAVAGLAMSCLRDGLEVRVVTTAGFDSTHGNGATHAPAILDGLAASEAHRPRPDVAPFRVAGSVDPVVLITTDRCSDLDLQSAFGLGGPTGTTLVIFATGDSGTAQTTVSTSGRVVRVGYKDSFSRAWTQWEKTRC